MMMEGERPTDCATATGFLIHQSPREIEQIRQTEEGHQRRIRRVHFLRICRYDFPRTICRVVVAA